MFHIQLFMKDKFNKICNKIYVNLYDSRRILDDSDNRTVFRIN